MLIKRGREGGELGATRRLERVKERDLCMCVFVEWVMNGFGFCELIGASRRCKEEGERRRRGGERSHFERGEDRY